MTHWEEGGHITLSVLTGITGDMHGVFDCLRFRTPDLGLHLTQRSRRNAIDFAEEISIGNQCVEPSPHRILFGGSCLCSDRALSNRETKRYNVLYKGQFAHRAATIVATRAYVIVGTFDFL